MAARTAIYLDYQATTPLAPEAREAMLPWLSGPEADGFANPHSAHAAGRAAAAAVEVAREEVATLLPQGGRTVFTSGATEAINLAIRGVLPAGGDRNRIVTIATEHAAVLDTLAWLAGQGRELVILPVGRDGLVDEAAAEAAIDRRTALVAAMQVNNEIGVIQPLARLARMARRAGALMLVDAVQGYGRLSPPEDADLVAISAHKVHGPKGMGALWVRDGVALEPLIHGGGQEQGLRSGTLSPALCAGFGAAARLMRERRDADAAHVERLWTDAIDQLGPAWTINGATGPRYRGNLNVRRAGLDAARLMSALRSIRLSAGSACASGSGRPSHVLRALGLTDSEARASIRLGFGRYTDEAALAEALAAIREEAERQ